MIKKLLGIDKIEKEIKEIKEEILKEKVAMVKLWDWINYLHKKQEALENKIARLKEKNEKLKELLAKLIDKIDEIKVEEVDQNLVEEVKEINFNKGDEEILEVIYNLAGVNEDNAIETKKILENLQFKITQRGLRKKLENLEKIGIINSVKVGNKKFWYINFEGIEKLKKRLKKKEII